MQHQPGLNLRAIPRAPAAPIVADGIRIKTTVAVKRRGGDGRADSRVPPEPGVRDAVPEVKRAVGAGGREHGRLRGVEPHVVDAPHLGDLLQVRRVAVAAECEVDRAI